MKVLLIGWDGIDWGMVRPLLDQRLLPCFQHFLSDAVSGELQPVRPWDSAALWTSMATGQRATTHGVLGPLEVTPCGTRIRPTSRSTIKARPVWSTLSDAGLRTHAFGWPASHPAEPIAGVAVSDLFAEFGEALSVHPQRLFDTFCALRLLPGEIDAASLLTLLPRAAALNPMADQRLYVVAQFLATTASLHAAATWALEHEPWEFVAVRYDGLARLLRVFGPAYAAAMQGDPAGEGNEDVELFGGLIPNAMRFFDMLLRRLIELAGAQVSVMLVSEQGSVAQSTTKNKRPSRPNPGILIAKGPAFKPRRELDAASVCDVAPTILQIFGVNPEPGTHGGAWHHVLTAPNRGVETFDKLSRADDPARCSAILPSGIQRPASSIADRNNADACISEWSPAPDDDSVAHLTALGYRESPDEFLRFAIERLELERAWRLAEAFLDCRQYEQAAQVLEGLVQVEPSSKAYRSLLAELYFRAGNFEACRQMIVALQADGLETALGQLGLAAIASLDGRITEAVEHLRRAETMQSVSAAEFDMIGQLYLRLRRSEDAARAFDAAIARDSKLGTAHEGRSIAYLVAGDPPSAERLAREAIRLNPNSYEAQYHLGLALASNNRSDEAIEVLRAATQLDQRASATAHRYLAKLLEHRGDYSLAFHHRALADRCGSRMREPQFDIERFGFGLDLDPFSDDWLQSCDTAPPEARERLRVDS